MFQGFSRLVRLVADLHGGWPPDSTPRAGTKTKRQTEPALTVDSGITLGASAASSITNAGLIEKTGGTSTTGSVIAPGIANTGRIMAAAGRGSFDGLLGGGSLSLEGDELLGRDFLNSVRIL